MTATRLMKAATRTLTQTKSPHLHIHLRTYTSTQHSSQHSTIEDTLTRRKIPLVYDYLTPTSSHLLSVALADILPPKTTSTSRILPTTTSPLRLPHAHHLVYFPPAIPGKDLLPDGTDPLQSPGDPFVRRMWAGGSVRFNNDPAAAAMLDMRGQRVACLEAIRDVAIKGSPGSEKIFVGIERRVGLVDPEDESEETTRQKLGRNDEADFGSHTAVIERRNIVFMRERSKEQAIKDMEVARTKQLKPPADATFEHTFVPDAKLLFRYSALTYNAHAIHLDPEYCRAVEGHRRMLVHGPLSFTMLTTLLRLQLKEGEEVKFVEYRNLAPLYCDEPLRIRGKEVGDGRWEVWAETPEGGVAVKAKVETEVL